MVRCSSSAMYASRPYSTALSMPSAVCVANWAATSRSLGSNAGRSGRRRKTAAPITRRRPRSGASIARWPLGTVRPSPEQLGQRGPGGGGVAEDRPHPAQHLGERTAGPHLAQLGGRHEVGLRVEDRDGRGRAPRSASSPAKRSRSVRRSRSTNGRDGPLVAHRQRIAEIDEDRVGEGRHGRPAQPQHDLVQVYPAGDPPGGRPHETQPVALAPRGVADPACAARRDGPAGRAGPAGARADRARPRGAGSASDRGRVRSLRPGSQGLPAFVGGGLLRHAWDSVRPGRLCDAIAS